MEAIFHHFPSLLSRDDAEKHACQSPHPQPDPGLFSHLKRKRADTSDSSVAASPTKRRTVDVRPLQSVASQDAPPSDQMKPPVATPLDAPAAVPAARTELLPTPTLPEPVLDQSQVSPTEDKTKRNKAMQKVEAQINLEILMKHNELRLIEQELAKCQVALEQLRRCEIVPFPTEQGSPLSSMDVRSGTGPAVQPSPGFSEPLHAAPWGVTDGPYARHYARWLLPDPAFDSVSLDAQGYLGSARGHSSMEFRSMRGSVYDRQSFSSARSQRYAASSKFQALPSNYPPPKDRSSPLVIKRADGVWVKLICKWCQKDNISSVQGFLNHCRIAHQHNYASHEQAAADCGHVLEGDEAQNLTAPATPAVATPLTATPLLPATRPQIHPLITNGSARSGMSSAGIQTVNSTPVRPPKSTSKAARSAPSSVKAHRESTAGFVASPLMPHLSSQLKKMGMSVDLKQAVTEAKVKCDIDSIETLVHDDEVDDVKSKVKSADNGSGRAAAASNGGMRIPQPAETGSVPSKQTSFSASRNFGQRLIIPSSVSSSMEAITDDRFGHSQFFTPTNESQSFIGQSSPSRDAPETPDNMQETHMDRMDLSPNTIDSNPGMVTDHEDDEDVDPRFDSDHHMQMHNAPSPDDLRIHVHGQDEHHAHFDEHQSTPCTAIAPSVMYDHSHHSISSQPSKKKRGRPSKREKVSSQQPQSQPQ